MKLVSLLTLLPLAGCGYGVTSTLDPQYQTIHVAAFQNESREYDLQAPLTNAVIRKFLNDGRLRVVGRETADLVVEGTILNYDLRGLAFDDDDEVTQFMSHISARVRVMDSRNGMVLWQSPNVYGETTFATRAVGTSSDRQRGNTETFAPTVRSFQTDEENQAASEALEQLASEIFYRTIEPW